jgi:hypothetical protein
MYSVHEQGDMKGQGKGQGKGWETREGKGTRKGRETREVKGQEHSPGESSTYVRLPAAIHRRSEKVSAAPKAQHEPHLPSARCFH